jgi:2-phosphoglycolate phosphatase
MAILFDLDGTLLDTSHDIYYALTALMKEENKPVVSYDAIRPLISFGGKKILNHAFNLDPENNSNDSAYLDKILPRFWELNIGTNFKRAIAFPGINQLLDDLEKSKLTWGIVTNRIQSLTEPLLKSTGYFQRPACIVNGDTTNNIKPHPEPLFYACNLLQTTPQQCLYIGDAENDIIAGKAAGMATMAVGFGFVPPGICITSWNADYNALTASEILPWIQKWSKSLN